MNIVSRTATFLLEIRYLSGDDPQSALTRFESKTTSITAPFRKDFPELDIEMQILNEYPTLNTHSTSEVVDFAKSLTGLQSTKKVFFGTEAGLFSKCLGVPTV